VLSADALQQSLLLTPHAGVAPQAMHMVAASLAQMPSHSVLQQ
jgi:hypothetical protein